MSCTNFVVIFLSGANIIGALCSLLSPGNKISNGVGDAGESEVMALSSSRKDEICESHPEKDSILETQDNERTKKEENNEEVLKQHPPNQRENVGSNFPIDLMNSCEVWIRNNWNLSGQPLVQLIQNPYIFREDSIVIKRFFHALKTHDLNLDSDSFLFGWHGTTAQNISSICKAGFDPYMRQGQQYGIGEYFGLSSGISHGYCKGGHFMLVVLLLKGKWLDEQSGSSYIVRNPIPPEHSYCLPLIVVNFGKYVPSPFEEMSIDTLSIH